MGVEFSKSMPPSAAELMKTLCAGQPNLEALRGLDLDIENLALEGGGAKGISYIGVLLALEAAGLLSKTKRFAGSSYGGIIAANLAMGASLEVMTKGVFSNSSGGIFGLIKLLMSIPGLMKNYGLDKMTEFEEMSKLTVKTLTGSEDTTFIQLYKKRGVELCLTGTNVNKRCVEYFHPKTTPNMTIVKALRITVSFPVVIAPVHLRSGDVDHLMVDGGLADNFPLHVFDGWYLSMEQRHSFFRMVNSKEPPFHGSNLKTIGAVVFDVSDYEANEAELMARYGNDIIERPDTCLVRIKKRSVDEAQERKTRKLKLGAACEDLLESLSASDGDRNGFISKDEFRVAMKKPSKETIDLLFGAGFNLETAFDEIDASGDGKISIDEFLQFTESKGHRHDFHLTTSRIAIDINNFPEFLGAIVNLNGSVAADLIAKEGDLNRTIGVYTDYVGTGNMNCEMEDIIFLIKQGWNATMKFLETKAGEQK
ncbi:uncharacterized protein LOC135492860 [Lineus longissimus]|uniref:uncharacterized protein LOC135492860 n=1 Tax=Lineus longissimus TaxID=88925 RepID=UPI002B4C3C6A